MDREYILCAAIWYKDFDKPAIGPINVERGVVLCGFRHPDIIHQHVKLLGRRQAEMGDYEQGFLTSEHRFVDRKEAAVIALKIGQVVEGNEIRGGRLYSEDLY